MKKQEVLTIVVIIAILGIGIIGYNHYLATTSVIVPESPAQNEPPHTAQETVSITEQTIKETTYTGTKPIIVGSGPLADEARTYIDQSIATFAAQADKEVPGLRKQFGNDAPPSHYTIDINAKTIDSAATQSIVVDSYIYMGGANGNSIYKVFTAKNDGTLLTIRDIVASDKQQAFVAFMKKELLAYRPDGSKDPVIFEDEVNDLTIDSFSNFSFDNKNLIIYFDKYQIGPGALGAVAFPVPLSAASQYITQP